VAVRRLLRWAFVAVVLKVVQRRLPHAQTAYLEARAAGSRPIEAVGTAVAAFVGLAPGGPVRSP
jgi:hypothetical protein